MKGFLITIALILAGGLGFFLNYDKIGQAVLDKLAVKEGDHDAILIEARKSDAGFKAKYEPLLKRRWTVCKVAIYLAEEWFVTQSKLSIDLYADTPATLWPEYGHFIYERARRLETTGNPPLLNEAFALYRQHQRDFPTAKEKALVNNAISRMITKYGMQ